MYCYEVLYFNTLLHSSLSQNVLCSACHIQDLFHVSLNRRYVQILTLHINKTNKFCFLLSNGWVPEIAKIDKIVI